jgi:integrase
MYEAGLRISDAILFEPGKLKIDAEVATYTFLPYKTRRLRRTCTTFVPLELAARIAALPALSSGLPFFDGGDLKQSAKCVRDEVRLAGDACGVPGVRPHRFRDSFAVNLLNSGVSVDIVSGYLGHRSIRTTEKYYAPWVQSRVDTARRKYLESQRAKDIRADVIEMPRRTGS